MAIITNEVIVFERTPIRNIGIQLFNCDEFDNADTASINISMCYKINEWIELSIRILYAYDYVAISEQ